MTTNTRLPAELFKLAIDLGRYDYWEGMCITLGELEVEGVITRAEELHATVEITNYMDRLKAGATPRAGAAYLRDALEYVGLPHDEEATTALYLDWDNRPYEVDYYV